MRAPSTQLCHTAKTPAKQLWQVCFAVIHYATCKREHLAKVLSKPIEFFFDLLMHILDTYSKILTSGSIEADIDFLNFCVPDAFGEMSKTLFLTYGSSALWPSYLFIFNNLLVKLAIINCITLFLLTLRTFTHHEFCLQFSEPVKYFPCIFLFIIKKYCQDLISRMQCCVSHNISVWCIFFVLIKVLTCLLCHILMFKSVLKISQAFSAIHMCINAVYEVL